MLHLENANNLNQTLHLLGLNRSFKNIISIHIDVLFLYKFVNLNFVTLYTISFFFARKQIKLAATEYKANLGMGKVSEQMCFLSKVSAKAVT